MEGVIFQQLVEKWLPSIAPEIPWKVLLAFITKESGGNFTDATHGTNNNRYTVPEFYELGVFQTPSGNHGPCISNKYESCVNPPPGVEGKDLSR